MYSTQYAIGRIETNKFRAIDYISKDDMRAITRIPDPLTSMQKGRISYERYN
jgi:hypothetical protein